jgi:parvulin-like peptidyl-prolyl isomerase
MTLRVALCGLLLAAVAAADRHLVEAIVVRVNDRVLTIRDMRRRMVERAAETGRPVQPSEYERFVGETADELCLLERAAELKLDVTKEEVDEAVAQLKEDNHLADDAAFRAMLTTTGMTEKQLRDRLHDTLLVRRVLAHEVGTLAITEEEVRQRYEREKASFVIPARVHLQHIVLSLAADRHDEAAKRARLERLAAAVRAGNDFLTLVEREVAAGDAVGGDLGELFVSDLRSEVAKAIEGLAPGQLAGPFESPAGLHLVLLVARLEPSFKPFEEVAQEVRERELNERHFHKLAGVVADLKTRYIVEVHPEYLTAP